MSSLIEIHCILLFFLKNFFFSIFFFFFFFVFLEIKTKTLRQERDRQMFRTEEHDDDNADELTWVEMSYCELYVGGTSYYYYCF